MTYADELEAALYLADNSGFEHTAKVLRKWLDREMAKEKANGRCRESRLRSVAERKKREPMLRSN